MSNFAITDRASTSPTHELITGQIESLFFLLQRPINDATATAKNVQRAVSVAFKAAKEKCLDPGDFFLGTKDSLARVTICLKKPTQEHANDSMLIEPKEKSVTVQRFTTDCEPATWTISPNPFNLTDEGLEFSEWQIIS